MNVWADNKEGRPVDDCRIIEMLRALDCNAATLIHCSRQLAAMHARIIDIIEALYKWDMNDNSLLSDAKLIQVVNDSFINATKAKRRSQMNREHITKILKKFGWEVSGDLTPLEYHIATEN